MASGASLWRGLDYVEQGRVKNLRPVGEGAFEEAAADASLARLTPGAALSKTATYSGQTGPSHQSATHTLATLTASAPCVVQLSGTVTGTLTARGLSNGALPFPDSYDAPLEKAYAVARLDLVHTSTPP